MWLLEEAHAVCQTDGYDKIKWSCIFVEIGKSSNQVKLPDTKLRCKLEWVKHQIFETIKLNPGMEMKGVYVAVMEKL